jgi:hypothetical protein
MTNAREYPMEAQHIVSWFWSLNAGRRSNGWGLERLSHSEIRDWTILHGVKPTPWEVETLRVMDIAFLEGLAEQEKEVQPQK